MTEEIYYCTKCVMPSTRPRISFNDDGVCNACQWTEEKKTLNWDARMEELKELCKKHKKINKDRFNIIIPVSGGKDSSYVAYRMKHEFGVNPLCLTINPPLQKEINYRNLEKFVEIGFDLMALTPNPEISREINKIGFIEQGRPMYSWMVNLQAAIFRVAVDLKIPWIMFGEEGETEYGGTSKLKNKHNYDLEHSINVYLSGEDPIGLHKRFPKKRLYWWTYPSIEEFKEINLQVSHFSYFSNWDSYKHYLFSKDKLGLQGAEERNLGTYNNFAQNDTILYDLHCYLMYIKFGFGRCSQDVGIDIRRGALTRQQGIKLVKMYDGESIEPYINEFLDYFKITREEFDAVITKWTNKKLFDVVDGKPVPNFVPE